MYYEESRIKWALSEATRVINIRTKKSDRYIRGYNDCFAFLLAYEQALRGEQSLTRTIILSYSDSKDFFKAMEEKLNHRSLEDFAVAMKFEPVKDRKPLAGDIAFEAGTAMVADKAYWLSTNENLSGIRPVRRMRAKEVTPSLMARPINLGD